MLKASDSAKLAMLETISKNDASNATNDRNYSVGLYFITEGRGVPVESDGFLICLKYSDRYMKQIYLDDNHGRHNLYLRSLDNNNQNPQWLSWVNLTNIVDPGEEYEIKEWYSGGVAPENNVVYFTVPFNKNLQYINSITIKSLNKLRVYNNGNTTDISMANIQARWIRDNYVTFSASGSFTKNAPTNIQLDNMIIQFN